MLLFVNIIGWLGSILLIAAYYLNSKNHLNAQSFIYQFLNVVGSLFLIINTIYFGAYPSAVVNIIWVFIGMYYISKIKNNEQKVEQKVY